MTRRFLATLLCLFFLCTYGYAQRGLQSVGMNVSYNDDFSRNKGFGIGVKYHYYLSNYIRVSPTIRWILMTEMNCERDAYKGMDEEIGMPYYRSTKTDAKTTGLDMSVDFHWFFIPPNRLRSYLITGISYGGLLEVEATEDYYWGYSEKYFDYVTSEDEYATSWKSKFALNYGIGLNWEVAPTISLQFEAIRRVEIGNHRTVYDDLIIYRENSIRPFTYIQIAIGASYNF